MLGVEHDVHAAWPSAIHLDSVVYCHRATVPTRRRRRRRQKQQHLTVELRPRPLPLQLQLETDRLCQLCQWHSVSCRLGWRRGVHVGGRRLPQRAASCALAVQLQVEDPR